jgi:hypothetical protein
MNYNELKSIPKTDPGYIQAVVDACLGKSVKVATPHGVEVWRCVKVKAVVEHDLYSSDYSVTGYGAVTLHLENKTGQMERDANMCYRERTKEQTCTVASWGAMAKASEALS